jgi:uncharacterized protein (TIGR00730 family)
MKRIAVFCGARAGKDDAYLPIAADAGHAIARAGFGLVYGGGRVGMMGALADAALAEGAEVIGVIPESLATAEVAHRGITTLHIVGSMHERKALIVELSDAFIALPGGIGTMDEFCEVLTWRQLGIHDKPIGLLNHAGFYDPLLALFDQMLDQGLLLPPTRRLLADAPDIAGLLAAFDF